MVRGTQKVVLRVLEENKASRDDDYLLWCEVLKEFGFDTERSVNELLVNFNALSLPSFKFVERCRRHFQELRPDLRGIIQFKRLDKEQDYKILNRESL